jgi:4-amino-4-deoxy-L-arabinose transferase-like glycosyltransferase
MNFLLKSRKRAYAVVIAVCALPRIAVLVHERADVLQNFEKSYLLAQLYLKDGTFGYVPGHPSAYTQPFYGWFLIVVFWIAGFHWWSVGAAQILVACLTSITVFEIGRRFISAWVGLAAAVIATLQPYLVWHDIHGNREILDQLLGAAVFGLTLALAARRSLALAALLGLVSGVAILSNSRLVLLPFVLALFLLARWHWMGWLAAIAIPVLAGVAMAPWVVRNKEELGCWAITTDARALWKANNVNTYKTLARGLWLDQVPDIPQRGPGKPLRWYTPEEAGTYYTNNHVAINIDECYQERYYEHLVFQFWKKHPGEKAKLMVQATRMLWDPRVGIEGAQESGVDSIRKWVEPLYTVPLYLLAIVGLFVVSSAVRWLALTFALYETAAAWVFAGTTRYRVAWDFVLALLAAAALEAGWKWLRRRQGRTSAPVAARTTPSAQWPTE